MKIAALLAAIAPFLKQELVNLEPAAVAELNSLVGQVSNPIAKEVLQDFVNFLAPLAESEIAKIP